MFWINAIIWAIIIGIGIWQSKPKLESIDGISACQLTERQRRIVDRLVETGQWNVLENVLENALETSATLAALLGVDARTIRRDLNTLQSKGVIRRDGPDRGGRRVILKKIEA